MVIIDTSIWVQAYRVQASPERAEVERLVQSGEAATLGLILAEVLRGARSETEFDEITEELLATRLLDSNQQTWILAGRILFDLRLRGQTIPLPDAVIAAHALAGDHELYSLDEHFSRVPGLKLHEVGGA